MRYWWMSCRRFTCLVVSDKNDRVAKGSAAIVGRFRGQHIKNLVKWMKKLGGFRFKELTNGLSKNKKPLSGPNSPPI